MATVSPDSNLDSAKDHHSEHDLTPPKVTAFTDDDGVLIWVKWTIKAPCRMLFLVFSFCLIVTALLGLIVFAAGNPITEGTSEFDIFDVRSVAYHSLDFASLDTDFYRDRETARLQALEGAGAATKAQVEGGEFTYWIYESRSSKGVFTPKGLEMLKKTEELITKNDRWSEFCYLRYDLVDDTQSACRLPLSPLNVFAASEWDSTVVQSIMTQLDAIVPGISSDALGPFGAPTGTTVFNFFSFCVKLGVDCDPNLKTGVTMTTAEVAAGLAFATALDVELLAVTSKWDGSGELSTKIDEVSLFSAYVKDLPAYAFEIDFYFDLEFSKTNPISKYSRTIIFWGSPIIDPDTGLLFAPPEEAAAGFEPDPEDVYRKEFIVDEFLSTLDRYATDGYNSDVNAYYFMGVLIFDVFIAVLQNDMILAIASISVVFLYMRLMLNSWFLAAVGMAEIVFSIPLAWFIAVVILQIKYFSGLNPMCLFIVAAIGADDIFVFMDAFKQSASKGPLVNASLETRMTWTYRRAGLAMLITSATTCSAFLSCTISSIASTQSFGIFAALVIAMDYLLVMTLFCTAVTIFHNRYEVTSKNPCLECGLCCGYIACCSEIPDDDRSTAKALRGDALTTADDRITAFYKGPITNFVLNKTFRIVTFACFAVWLGISFYFVLQLKPTKQSEQLLSEDHPLQKAVTILDEEFPTASEDVGASIYFSWGVEEVDRTGVNQLLNPDDLGKPRFVPDWTFNPTCQQKVLDLCLDLRANPKYDAHVKNDETGFATIQCWVMELEDWVKAGSGVSNVAYPATCIRPTTTFTDFPIAEEDVNTAMNDFNNIFSCTDEYEFTPMIDTYQDARGGNSANPNHIGWDGAKLKYVAISVESAVLDPFALIAEKLARVEYDFFIDLTKEIDADMSEACGPVIMTDMNQKFVFMNNQRLYRSSAATGALLGCVIAFAVIWIATKSLPIAFISTFTILCVLISVVGAVTMIGWTLGTTTSILISILAGFSVDYVVHLAHAYVTTPGTSAERIAGSFGEMGVSVMSGMMTSILASIPLFFCQIVFFSSFGTFLCLTIAFSWVFANFFFMGLLATFGVIPNPGTCIPARFMGSGGANVQETKELE